MSLPLIGITGNLRRKKNHLELRLREKYITAIQAAGGLPVILSPDMDDKRLVALAHYLDGILFSGGVDVDPLHFNGIPHPSVEADEPERDDFEIRLVKLAVDSGLPFLGICRGLQVINIALGGSLYTHLPEQLEGEIQHDRHDVDDRGYLAHHVRLESGCRLATLSKSTDLEVNSLHHQGIKDLAPVLNAVGWSEDGLIEAIEMDDHPYALAVQWHPEELQDRLEVQALFLSFVKAADYFHDKAT